MKLVHNRRYSLERAVKDESFILVAVEMLGCAECTDLTAGVYKKWNRRASRGQRIIIYNRDGGRCHYCNVPVGLDNFHADHIIPWSKCHSTDTSNLVTSCYMCNVAKHTFSYEWFKSSIETKGLEWRRRRYFAVKNQYRNKVS